MPVGGGSANTSMITRQGQVTKLPELLRKTNTSPRLFWLAVVLEDGEHHNATDTTLDFLGNTGRIHSLRLRTHAKTEKNYQRKPCGQQCRTNVCPPVLRSKKKRVVFDHQDISRRVDQACTLCLIELPASTNRRPMAQRRARHRPAAI